MADAIINVNRTHPVYDELLPNWQFYMDSYRGGLNYKDPSSDLAIHAKHSFRSYLHAHSDENIEAGKFLKRHNKSYFTNWCALPVNTFIKYIYGEKYPIEREYNEGSGYEDYINDIDLSGTSINAFQRSQTTMTLVYGLSYILVDRAPLTSDIRNLDDQRKSGIRAYAQSLSPEMVVDWSIDQRTGQYNWVLIKVAYRDDSDFTEVATDETRYYLWTTTEVYYLDSKGELIIEPDLVNPAPNNLGFVPIIKCIYNDIDKDGEPESFLSTIAEINREIYNVTSLYQEELYKLAFAQIMKQRGDKNWTEDMDAGANSSDLSVSRFLEWDAGSAPPQYLEFPVGALVEKRADIDELVQHIMRLSNLGNHSGVDTTSMQSGLAMGFAYSDTYSTAAHISAVEQSSERQLWGIIQAYDQENGRGLINGDIIVTYPSTFDIRADIEKRENYKLTKQELTGSPTALVKADLQWARDNIVMDDKDEVVVETELTDHYVSENDLAITDVTEITDNEVQTELNQ